MKSEKSLYNSCFIPIKLNGLFISFSKENIGSGYRGRKKHGGSYVPVGYPTSNGTGIRSQQIKPFINSIKRLFKK